MKKIILLAVTLLFVFATTAVAQNESVKNEPGYFNFAEFGEYNENDLMTEVHLGPHLLKLAAKATEKNEEGIGDVISGLKLIKVEVYRVGKEQSEVTERMEKMNDKLNDSGWERIVMSKDDGNRVFVFIKTKDDIIVGLVVTAYESPDLDDEGQAVYVNIVGDIDLEKIGELSSKFDIPNLDKVKDSNHQGNHND